MVRLVLAAACGVLMTVAGPAQAQAVKMSELASPKRIVGTELGDLVKGATVSSTTDTGVERNWTDAVDGTLAAQARRPSGGTMGTARASGTWRVDGDKYCVDIDWRATKEAWCAMVFQVGDRHYTARSESPDASARPIRFDK